VADGTGVVNVVNNMKDLIDGCNRLDRYTKDGARWSEMERDGVRWSRWS
jgi:hypothetical protein